MPNRPFRFIHAGDFHLETPPHGVLEVPDHLRDVLLESAYTAATRVFDAALAEEAEFVILSGDIVNVQAAGLRAPVFLADQFGRLARRGIAVYWAGGEVDPPDAWPSAFALPENVHMFPRGRAGQSVHLREGTPLARLVGLSRDGQRLRPADFEPDPAGLFSIAVVHGAAEPATLQSQQGIHYWALGGRHDRGTLLSTPTIVHYPGSPQGRCPQEPAAHGCTLVQVDERGQGRPSLVATDAIRWMTERIAIDAAMERESLENLFRERIHALIESTPKIDLMISWTLVGSGPLITSLRHEAMRDQTLDALRAEYGAGSPAAWSVALEVEPTDDVPAAWYEQDQTLDIFDPDGWERTEAGATAWWTDLISEKEYERRRNMCSSVAFGELNHLPPLGASISKDRTAKFSTG